MNKYANYIIRYFVVSSPFVQNVARIIVVAVTKKIIYKTLKL
jgi:hypothetical protein